MRNKIISHLTLKTLKIFCTSLCISSYAIAGDAKVNLKDIEIANSNSCQTVNTKPLTSSNFAKLIESNNLQLLGTAKFSVLFWDIYESRLLTSDGQLPLSHPCQYSMFEIKYLRDITKQELIENTVAQWQHLAITEKEYQPYLVALKNIWPDIRAGDQLILLNNATTTLFYFNQQKVGEIESEVFADLFLQIGLDENTSEPTLRKQLLGELI